MLIRLGLIGLAFLLAGCSARPPAAPAIAVVETTAALSTLTFDPTPTATPEPTATPTPTDTPPPTVVPTPIDTPTAEPAAPLTTTLALDNSFFTANPPPLVLRRGPEDYFQTVGSVLPDAEVTLLGRNETGSKVLVRLSDGAEGWAWRHVFTADKDAALALPVVEAPAELLDEEKIERIEFGGALDPAGRYVAYLKEVIRRIQAEDKSGVAPIPNTREELINAPGYAEWAAAFEAGVGYPAEQLLSELTQEDWLYPTYGAEYAGPLRILVYVSEDQQGLIGWDWAGYLPKYIPVINIPKHYLDRALAGDRDYQIYVKNGIIKEMIAGVAGQLAAAFDPNGKYDPIQSGERLSLFAEYEYLRQQGFPPEFVDFYYQRAGEGYVHQAAKTGEIRP